MGRNGRVKGSRFELEIAKQLSEWWGEAESFRRTPLSGAWDKRAAGDLVTPDEFPFTAEMKNQEGWEFSQLLTSGLRKGKEDAKCMLDEFWEQAVRETKEGKAPLLVFTRNFQPAFYMMRVSDYERIVVATCTGVYDHKYFLTHDGRTIGLFNDLLQEWRCPRTSPAQLSTTG